MKRRQQRAVHPDLYQNNYAIFIVLVLIGMLLMGGCALRRPPSVVELAVSVEVTLGQLQDEERKLCNVVDASTKRPITTCTPLAHQMGLTTALHIDISLQFLAAFAAQREVALALSKGDPLKALVPLGQAILRLDSLLTKINGVKETQMIHALIATLKERVNALGKGVS
jgi:hypothetical protein